MERTVSGGGGDEMGSRLFVFSREREKKVLRIIRTTQEAQPSPAQQVVRPGTGVLRVVGEVSPAGDCPHALHCSWRRDFPI